jgi:hypothetical protein
MIGFSLNTVNNSARLIETNHQRKLKNKIKRMKLKKKP